jgi:Zn-finger nucleic acid-binding protein
LKCPRDGAELHAEHQHGVDLHACKTCRGAWYSLEELAALELTAARDEAGLAGMLEYSKRPSDLACAECGGAMVAFDYRGNNLELDACPGEHGFWLDTGESERVRQIMQDRARGLLRSVRAERNWNRSREGGFNDSIIDRMRDLFRRR